MIDFMVWLEGFRTPLLDKVFNYITMIGEETFILVIMCIVFWSISKKAGYRLGFSVVLSAWINSGVKDILKVTRPYNLDNRLHPLRLHSTNNTYSLPSGHTQNTATLFTSLALSVKKGWFTIIAIIMMLLVGFSRIYLSLHTPLDVIVGLILGIGIVFLSHYILDFCEKKKITWPLFLLLIPVITSMYFLQTESFYKMAGLCIAFIIGYIIESKFIKFKVTTTFLKHIGKIILGLVIALALKEGLKFILPDTIIFHSIRYFLLGTSVVVLSPWLFKKLKWA